MGSVLLILVCFRSPYFQQLFEFVSETLLQKKSLKKDIRQEEVSFVTRQAYRRMTGMLSRFHRLPVVL